MIKGIGMKKLIHTFLALLVLTSFAAFSEGTKQIRPTASSFGQLNPWDWGGEFATYDAPMDRRMYVRIADHTVEKMYLGFQAAYGGKTYLRIKDPNGNVVFGPFELQRFSNNVGWIQDYNEAIAGPVTFDPGGYVPVEFNPTMNGDYYIELNRDSINTKVQPAAGVNGGYRYPYFDITVADTTTNTIKEGRLWAYLWALTTFGPGNSFDANLFILREDSIRFEVDYNGIDPFGFGIVSNSYGVDSTGNFQDDRKSTATKYTQGTVVYFPEHMIFLNPPDTAIWPFPKVAPDVEVPINANDLITGCITTGYCINIEATKSGQVEVKLDFNGIPGIQPNTTDRIVTGLVGPGVNCVAWDGLDGFGDTALSANIEIDYKYEAGLIHIPIYDAENHPNGYIFKVLNNASSSTNLSLYWDDTKFASGVNASNFTGCSPLPCRDWNTDYGNERFINTWSFAFDQTIILSNIRFEYCPPNAIDDTTSANEATPKAIKPLANDEKPLNKFDLTTLVIKRGPQNGFATVDTTTGTVTYTSNVGFAGMDTICYAICDTHTVARCDSAFIIINVIDINLPPGGGILNGDTIPPGGDTTGTVSVPEDSVLTLCFEWIDSEGDSIFFNGLAPAPSNGTILGLNDGDSCFTFIPDPGYDGPDTIGVIICDNGSPQACDTIYIPVFTDPVNDPPDIIRANGVDEVNDTIQPITIMEDDSVDICLDIIDPESEAVNISLILKPVTNGTLYNVFDSDSCFGYVPDPNYFGSDTVVMVVCDQGSPVLCDTVTIIIDILPVNDPPIAVNDFNITDPLIPVSTYVLGNDSDVETKNLTFSIVDQPSNGSAVISQDSIVYTPHVGFNFGLDTLTYAVCDTGAPVFCDTAILVIIVPSSDLPPTAVNDTTSTPEDVTVNIDILINDFDFNLDPLTPTILTNPTNGSAVINAGQLEYTPNMNFNGLDSVEYVVCDTTAPTPFCDTAWAFITVTPLPDFPGILDSLGNPVDKITYNIDEDTPTVICLNANDADNQPVDVTQALVYLNNGVVTGVSDSDTCFTYSPKQNFHGVDSVRVLVCDNGSPSLCDTVIILINIDPVNDKPIAINDTISLPEGGIMSLFPASNDLDTADNAFVDPSTIQIINGPFNGGAVINPNWSITYTPNAGYDGRDSIQYVVCDTAFPLPAMCDTAWIQIFIDPINDRPTAVNDTVSTTDNTLEYINVLGNDIDPEGDSLMITMILTNPDSGSAVVFNDTSILYRANLGFCGIDSLQYVMCDKGLPAPACDTAWVFITVLPADWDGDSLRDEFETLTRNSDNDTVPDYRDIDSDNDGITDYIEAIPIGDICNPMATDFDGDGVPDYRDPDSDNDGIPDYVERSIAWVLPTGNDSDGDGIDDAFDPDSGGYLEMEPVDFDGDGFPDFRDIDSDGDGIPDWVEGSANGVPPTGVDTDGDGIDDAWDISNGGTGLYNAPVDTDSDGFPDFRDLDSDEDGLSDNEEKGPDGNNPVDSDGDGSPDFRDVDSDNDGIPDDSEGNDSDCNNNGIPDYLDPEPCDVFVPQGLSPNSDGSNDAFVIENIENYPNNTLMIFNRWGNKVYEKRPYDNSWQGESTEGGEFGSSATLPAGTYFYILDLGNGTPALDGYVYLKR